MYALFTSIKSVGIKSISEKKNLPIHGGGGWRGGGFHRLDVIAGVKHALQFLPKNAKLHTLRHRSSAKFYLTKG